MQELGRLLQEPLQPKYSQRFFAGRPSAALAGSGNADEEENGADVDPQAVSQVTSLLMTARACNIVGTRSFCVNPTISSCCFLCREMSRIKVL